MHKNSSFFDSTQLHHVLSSPPKLLFLCLLISLAFFIDPSSQHLEVKKKLMREKVRQMFYHAYDNYMTYAFPHNELKPLTKSFTDSLSELGNLKLEHLPTDYNGSAVTLVESLSSLAILGNSTSLKRGFSGS